MNEPAVVAAFILGLVFEWSGVAKVASRRAWQVEGTPFATGHAPVDRLIRLVLPWCEVVLGALLMFGVALRFAGLAAGLLLIGFTVALVRVLSSGQRPTCMCFGASRAKPVSWLSVVRNAVLFALAVTTVVGA
ncbi:MAG: hypothetical protein RL743_1270 [Actinomycetota bacterium]|jgi:uncharacterized membrane protein YphA (DoxX/SURF4 family)